MIERISLLLGLSTQQVKVYILALLVVMGVMLYLAIESGVAFYRSYQQSWELPSETQEPMTASEKLMRDANAPTWVSENKLLPGGVLNETGQLVYCTDALAGNSGLKYGWVWDADTHGCRKFRQINLE